MKLCGSLKSGPFLSFGDVCSPPLKFALFCFKRDSSSKFLIQLFETQEVDIGHVKTKMKAQAYLSMLRENAAHCPDISTFIA